MSLTSAVRAAALGAAALTLGACATAGLFPSTGDPTAAIPNAERLIAEARTAGADELAPEALASATQNLADARAQQGVGHTERAALKAREAAADAEYARAAAERTKAQRQREAAQAALNALPGGGQ